jgi:hypothetical protein
MNENRELAQNIIDRYSTILGVFPVYTFCLNIPDIRVNKKGKVVSIENDKVTLLKLINALEPYTGKYIKKSLITKYQALFKEVEGKQLS